MGVRNKFKRKNKCLFSKCISKEKMVFDKQVIFFRELLVVRGGLSKDKKLREGNRSILQMREEGQLNFGGRKDKWHKIRVR